MKKLYLLGIDIGSTTTSLLTAEAELLKNCVTGRMELDSPKVLFKSEPVFTPFQGKQIHIAELKERISGWLSKSGVPNSDIAGGGAIVTGLASKKENADQIKQLIKSLVSETLVATAEDPHLESWLAFKGSVEEISQSHPNHNILNIDIGGGTTNLALGKNGQVLSTGCLFIGARHFQFEAGTSKLTEVSAFGHRMMKSLRVSRKAGDILSQGEIQKLVSLFVSSLESTVAATQTSLLENLFDYTAEMRIKETPRDSILTFSGGVGELVYQFASHKQQTAKTRFGDLGEELALGILASPLLSKDIKSFVPANLGRATVYGMTVHQFEVSGITTYLSRSEILPLQDLPIISHIDLSAEDKQIHSQVSMLLSASVPSAAFVTGFQSPERESCLKLKAFFDKGKLPPHPVVLFLEGNLGKTLGNYLTDWGKSPLNLVILDEIPLRNAQFASVGKLVQNFVPVSFYGMK